MRKNLLASACALSLVLGTTSAFAGAYGEPVESEEAPAAAPAPVAETVVETVDYARTGPYLGLGGLYGVELFDDHHHARTSNSGGFHVQAGYRFHPNAAAEIRYENFFQFDLDPGQINVWTTTINLKGYILTGRVQPYALLGMGYMHGDGSAGNFPFAAHPSNGFAMRFGAGLDTYVTEHIFLGPEIAYTQPTGSANDLDMFVVSFGVNYKF